MPESTWRHWKPCLVLVGTDCKDEPWKHHARRIAWHRGPHAVSPHLHAMHRTGKSTEMRWMTAR